ncbi:meiotic recombination protein REC114 isoform X2 [Lathamus discolor]|uniref:meiotic recombination protein REC114 isoform X2 n=1 Tax=Lathamus discolor TaxID=678569 RepID=UPI0032B791D4
MAAGGGRGSAPGQGSAPGDTSLLASATTWPLKRYGRFLPPADRDEEGQNAASWKVFESNEESGHLILTVVVSGHFFISQGRTVLNEGRMFRVQFGGDSKEEMLENCWSCVQKLTEYVPVQGTEEQSQQLFPSFSQLAYGDSQPDEPLPDSCAGLGERRSVPQLAQSVLNKKLELPSAPWHPVWGTQELGPFIRFCLLDQHFPAFVQAVEKELQKLTEG